MIGGGGGGSAPLFNGGTMLQLASTGDRATHPVASKATRSYTSQILFILPRGVYKKLFPAFLGAGWLPKHPLAKINFLLLYTTGWM